MEDYLRTATYVCTKASLGQSIPVDRGTVRPSQRVRKANSDFTSGRSWPTERNDGLIS